MLQLKTTLLSLSLFSVVLFLVSYLFSHFTKNFTVIFFGITTALVVFIHFQWQFSLECCILGLSREYLLKILIYEPFRYCLKTIVYCPSTSKVWLIFTLPNCHIDEKIMSLVGQIGMFCTLAKFTRTSLWPIAEDKRSDFIAANSLLKKAWPKCRA